MSSPFIKMMVPHHKVGTPAPYVEIPYDPELTLEQAFSVASIIWPGITTGQVVIGQAESEPGIRLTKSH